MKANELMIGDRVEVCNQYRPINGISHNSVEFSGYIANIEEIEPIPITPEILEKNKFTIFDNPSTWTWSKITYKSKKHINVEVIIALHSHGYWVHAHNLRKLKTFEGPVKYVHELQHILNICKIEKEIEL